MHSPTPFVLLFPNPINPVVDLVLSNSVPHVKGLVVAEDYPVLLIHALSHYNVHALSHTSVPCISSSY